MQFSCRRAILVFCLLLGLAGGSLGEERIRRCGSGYLERRDGHLVLHVKGAPYEIGYQHGALLKEECRGLLAHLFETKAKEATVRVLGMELGPKEAIRLIHQIQKSYLPERFVEEMRGLADGAEVDLESVLLANLIPELFHCSGFALLAPLTTTGTLLHGRILDYATDWRLQEFAVLVIAEPQGRVPFANVTYSGFIGSVTGMNQAQISIGEMGGGGLGQWAGTPMSLLVRRVLEEARTLDEARAILEQSRRTCEYYYVIADAKSNDAIGVDGSHDRFTVVRPGQRHERLPTPVPNSVLLSAGDRYHHLCRRVRDVHETGGRFTPQEALRLMDAPIAMKSNLHNVLMAPGLGKLWIAHASPAGEPAWRQEYHEFDFWKLLEQPGPVGGTELPVPTGSSGR